LIIYSVSTSSLTSLYVFLCRYEREAGTLANGFVFSAASDVVGPDMNELGLYTSREREAGDVITAYGGYDCYDYFDIMI
jgi:hypothetical protein